MGCGKYEEAFEMMKNLHSTGVSEFSGVPVEDNERKYEVVKEMKQTVMRLLEGCLLDFKVIMM